MKLSSQKGFTLLEIMIALFIFVIIMAMIVTGFNVVLRSRDLLQEKSDRLEKIQMAITIIERDLMQITDRPIRDNDGVSVLPAMYGPNSEKDLLEFTRAGFVNPFWSLPRSTLLRVAYHFENGQLTRKVWQVLDRAPSSRPDSRVLLDGVQLFEVNYLNLNNEFVPEIGSTIPRAVQFKINFENGDIISRMLLVKGGR